MSENSPAIEAPRKKGNGRGEEQGGNDYAALKKNSPTNAVITEATIALVCIGRTPLLMDPMSEEVIVRDLIMGGRPPKDTTTPVEERAARKIYRNEAGKIGLPAGMLFASLRGAGRKIKVGPRATLTKYDGETALPAIMTIREMFLELKHPDVKDFETAWKTDVRRGQLATGTTCGIIRPKFDKWGFEVTIDVDYTGMEGLSEQHIRDLFTKSGRVTGLGSFRPSCGGQFGTYDVAEFEILEQK